MIDNRTTKETLLSIEEKIQLLNNMLADPDDYISHEILVLNGRYEDALKDERVEAGSNAKRLGLEQ